MGGKKEKFLLFGDLGRGSRNNLWHLRADLLVSFILSMLDDTALIINGCVNHFTVI